MMIESSRPAVRTQSPRGFESEPADEWRDDYGRGGPVRSNEPERDWFFEQNADSNSEANAASPGVGKRKKQEPQTFRGLGPKGYRPSDERIQELICERLTEHPNIDASEIELGVECGIVRLQGAVATEAMKQTLLQMVRTSLGVIGIVDELDVRARSAQ